MPQIGPEHGSVWQRRAKTKDSNQGFADSGVLLWLRAHRGRFSAERMLMKVSNAAAKAVADEVASAIVIENECAGAWRRSVASQ